MEFRYGAPLLQDSSAGDGPFVRFPASHVHSWGDFILKRRCGYVAQRVGEASHPCPGGKAAQQRKQMEAPLQAVLGEGAAIRLLVMLFSLLIGNQGGIAGLQHILRSNGLLAPESDVNTASQATAKPKRMPRKPKSGNAPPLMAHVTANPSRARTVTVSEGASGQPEAKRRRSRSRRLRLSRSPRLPPPRAVHLEGSSRQPKPVLRKDDWSGDLAPYGELANSLILALCWSMCRVRSRRRQPIFLPRRLLQSALEASFGRIEKEPFKFPSTCRGRCCLDGCVLGSIAWEKGYVGGPCRLLLFPDPPSQCCC